MVFSAKLYDLPFRNARGGGVTTPPPGRSCYEKWPGRARVNDVLTIEGERSSNGSGTLRMRSAAALDSPYIYQRYGRPKLV